MDERRRIRDFVISVLSTGSRSRLAPHVAEHLDVHCRLVYTELRQMVAEGILAVDGKTLRRLYTLRQIPIGQCPDSVKPVTREKPMGVAESKRLEMIARERADWANRRLKR